jgi:segregation and condensation protein A
MALAVRELPLDLDAFEGPFDLLLTLVIKEELELAEVEVADIVVAFVERLEKRGGLDLEACGEFLVLVAALLELKARRLFPDEELDFEDLDPADAAAELAERLALYRRFKAAAAWLEERLAAEGDRFFRVGPAPLAPLPARPLAPQDPRLLAEALRALALAPPEPSLGHLSLAYPPVSRFLERFRALVRSRGRFAFDREMESLSRVEQIVAFIALLELRKRDEVRIGQAGPFEPITVWNARSS